MMSLTSRESRRDSIYSYLPVLSAVVVLFPGGYLAYLRDLYCATQRLWNHRDMLESWGKNVAIHAKLISGRLLLVVRLILRA
jgi:hypothetical protein